MAEDFEAPTSGADSVTELVDLERYELDGLRADIVELVDFPEAVARTAGWTLAGPVVVALFTWFYFADKMPTWVLVPFTLIAIVLSLLASVLFAIYRVTLGRVEEATKASSRVLDTIELAQGDLTRLAAGEVNLSVHDLTTEVLESAVFPGLEDGVVAMVPWPLTYAARPLVWVPRRVIQKTVMKVVDRLPIERLSRNVAVDDDNVDDLGRLHAAIASFPDDLSRAQAVLEQTVDRVIGATRKPVIALVAVNAIPLLIWLLIGDALA